MHLFIEYEKLLQVLIILKEILCEIMIKILNLAATVFSRVGCINPRKLSIILLFDILLFS